MFCFNFQTFVCDGITNKPEKTGLLQNYFLRFLPQTEVKITELLTFTKKKNLYVGLYFGYLILLGNS